MALVHDAIEAYLSDVPGPAKKSFPGYKHVERNLDETIARALGLNVMKVEDAFVEQAHEVVGQYELAVYFPERDYEEPDDLRHDPSAAGASADDEAPFLGRMGALGLR